MSKRNDLVSAAINAASVYNEAPTKCSTCDGKGWVWGMFNQSKWDCHQCFGTGYVGDPELIAKFFREKLVHRSQRLTEISNSHNHIKKENEELKRYLDDIEPDWEAKLEARRVSDHMEKHSSRYD